ncbi:MAG: zf-HC2 domain-containing protein [Planctomycetota bacterium]|nr:zf-HC2 domain-containing protein [Planctomycetota bacterium]
MTCDKSVTCQACVEFLLDYLEGVLPQEQQASFDQHMAACPNCVTYVENYRQTAMLLRCNRAAQLEDAPKVPEELVRAILKAKAAKVS